jgi:vacuolar protein sorting-associated protein 54
LREAKLFDAKLGTIDGAGNVGAHLIGQVVSKQVAQTAQPKAGAAPAKSEEKQAEPAPTTDKSDKSKSEET